MTIKYFYQFLTFLLSCFLMTTSREIFLKKNGSNEGIGTFQSPFSDLDKAIEMIIPFETNKIIFLDQTNENLYVIGRFWEVKSNVEFLGQTSQINIAFKTNCGIYFEGNNSLIMKNINFKGENVTYKNYSLLRFLNLMVNFEVIK